MLPVSRSRTALNRIPSPTLLSRAIQLLLVKGLRQVADVQADAHEGRNAICRCLTVIIDTRELITEPRFTGQEMLASFRASLCGSRCVRRHVQLQMLQQASELGGRVRSPGPCCRHGAIHRGSGVEQRVVGVAPSTQPTFSGMGSCRARAGRSPSRSWWSCRRFARRSWEFIALFLPVDAASAAAVCSAAEAARLARSWLSP